MNIKFRFRFRQVSLYFYYFCSMVTGIPAMGLDDRPVPKTVDRIISNFTPDERRVLYDFAISKTGAASVLKVEELHMS